MSEPNLVCPACGDEATLMVITTAEIQRTPVWNMERARWEGVDDDDMRTIEITGDEALTCLVCMESFPIDDPNVPHT
jgi:uncharacterized protein YbaR (Trm112 family)